MELISGPTSHWVPAKSARLLAWERVMHEAVAATREGQWRVAHAHYAQALALSQALFDALDCPASRPDDTLAAFVVTRLNVADLQRQGGEFDLAAHGVCGAHRALLALTRDDAMPEPVRRAAFRHLRETHAALLAHLAGQGACPNVLHALRLSGMPFALQPACALH